MKEVNQMLNKIVPRYPEPVSKDPKVRPHTAAKGRDQSKNKDLNAILKVNNLIAKQKEVSREKPERDLNAIIKANNLKAK
jgi:hypothetical protein